MNFTKWFKLKKPEQEEFYDVDDFNFNADILDTELKNVKDSYLPLAGGTVTGDVTINGALTVPSGTIRTDGTSKAMYLFSYSTGYQAGAWGYFAGKDAPNSAGYFGFVASDGTNRSSLWGSPTGKLAWNGKHIVRSVNSVNADDNGNVSITSVNHAISADSAISATSASQNASGHLLTDTIVKSISIDGRTITVTKIDGTSYTLTTQDTNTVYTKLSQFVNDMGYITANGRAYPRDVWGNDINFHWEGKNGQPTWLLGGEEGTDIYVYNPANFSVNYATKAIQDKNGAQIDTTYFKSANGTFKSDNYYRDISNSLLRLNGGNTYNGGANLQLYGKDANGAQGVFDLAACTKEDASDAKQLIGTPEGELTWCDVNLVPTGEIKWFAFNTAPHGYLVCNGANISRTTYANLFAVIGTAFGSGDGSTTFALPNLIDKFAQGSTTVGTVKSAGIPNITASASAFFCEGDHINTNGAMYQASASYNNIAGSSDSVNQYTIGLGFDASRSSAVYGRSSTVQPPALTLLPCIKY